MQRMNIAWLIDWLDGQGIVVTDIELCEKALKDVGASMSTKVDIECSDAKELEHPDISSR